MEWICPLWCATTHCLYAEYYPCHTMLQQGRSRRPKLVVQPCGHDKPLVVVVCPILPMEEGGRTLPGPEASHWVGHLPLNAQRREGRQGRRRSENSEQMRTVTSSDSRACGPARTQLPLPRPVSCSARWWQAAERRRPILKHAPTTLAHAPLVGSHTRALAARAR